MKVVNTVKIIHNKSGFGIIEEVTADDGNNYARKTFSPVGMEKMSAKTLTNLKRRFSREVRTQEQLSPDFCIPIVHSSLEEKNPWFLMPIAEKVFTTEIEEARLAKRNPEGLADILNCLEYLHERGFTHRDIKPGNILYLNGGWKLADMGLITSDPELTTSFVTSDGISYGSLLYMAPEQYTDFQNVTHHADIYSFGAILHDIYNGRPRKPYSRYTSDGSIGVIIEKCTEEQIDLRFDNVNILRDVLLGTLAKIELKEEVTEDVLEWMKEMKLSENWNKDKLDAFNVYTDRDYEAKKLLFYEVSSQFIENTCSIDRRLWKRFVLSYFNWVENSSFDFNYCDVLIGHIKLAYDLAEDLSIKSGAVFSAAGLGRYHNRWYVMKFVVRMCSPQISDLLADRIAIEIRAIGDEAQNNLLRCVERIRLTKHSYHGFISDSL